MKEHLSLDEHKEIAKELIEILVKLYKIFGIIKGKVELKIARRVLSFNGLNKVVNQMRCDLEEDMFRWWGRDKEATIHIYYPNGKESEEN